MSIQTFDPNEIEALVKCNTTAGPIWFEFQRDWSPTGYKRVVELFDRGFYVQAPFYRVVPDFLVQFGISFTTDEALQDFAESGIPDDPQLDPPIAFDVGIVSFAGNGIDSRYSELFVALDSNPQFGMEIWETPVGTVVRGMDVIKSLYSYGDLAPYGDGPDQASIFEQGKPYMDANFPLVDVMQACVVERINRTMPAAPRNEHSNADDEVNPIFIALGTFVLLVVLYKNRHRRRNMRTANDLQDEKGYEMGAFHDDNEVDGDSDGEVDDDASIDEDDDAMSVDLDEGE